MRDEGNQQSKVSMDYIMGRSIQLPGGAHVPAVPGRYHVVPPPDLNEVTDKRFFLEYDFPFVIVREIALESGSNEEAVDVVIQTSNWKTKHPNVGGFFVLDRTGFQFNHPSASHEDGCHFQLIPSISYVDRRTWSSLSDQDKDKAYLPCIPTVVVGLVTLTEALKDLQTKVSKFVTCGTREGLVVDTRDNRVWIFNQGEEPTFEALDTVVFDTWTGFELDCIAIRDARARAGL
ncbi:uncharacterized protein PITG_04840 [Phytophthora infestans T30-4]|uniref:Putative restriction endonuclease domain-containing protein n=1 Tax=Phytophthora infestans (strain T30-4) TaxID=403677 RepID=D0N255_PHYIT|nr:uncharacterized protein PITG_04840 [Phytophthora infestans T30-4]EEY68384.1 hypothetical protein PITG_04840 [Phytophthora infestans T30-4]|eukprot:XP_002905543.1 hypothetical protein PITG_04840 [Phytophthora infestans T30-4]